MVSKLTKLASEKTSAQLQSMSRDAYQWLMKKIADIRNPSAIPRTIKAETERNTRRTLLGGLYFFYYDPKTKDELPYYDKFPLVLMLERYPDGFLGLNLHYLPIKYRVAFLDKLLQFAMYNEEDEIKRLRVTYEILSASKRFREFRPCIKKYLYEQIKSKILTFQPKEWETAIFLPMHQFKKAKDREVWQESVEQIRNS